MLKSGVGPSRATAPRTEHGEHETNLARVRRRDRLRKRNDRPRLRQHLLRAEDHEERDRRSAEHRRGHRQLHGAANHPQGQSRDDEHENDNGDEGRDRNDEKPTGAARASMAVTLPKCCESQYKLTSRP